LSRYHARLRRSHPQHLPRKDHRVHRRFALITVLGVLCFGAFSRVVFAAGLSAPPNKKPPSTTTSTTTTSTTTTTTTTRPAPPPPSSPPPSGGGGTRTPVSCGPPDAKHDVAPAIGSTNKYQAGEGGSADVTRSAQTELKVGNVTPSPGWTDIVFTPSGQNVRVKYTEGANPHHYVHLVVSLNNAGTEIHVRVTSCK
jgi:hypothetical protein